jgi:protein ImuA
MSASAQFHALAQAKNAHTPTARAAEPIHPRVALGHEAADACLKGGILKGALHEVFAAEAGCEASASGFAAALAMRVAQNSTAQHKQLLWIRHDFSALEFGELSATGLLELGLDPARVLVLRAPDVTSALRASGDALTCASLGAVILEIPGRQKLLDLVTSRRLTLAAQKKGVSVFLLRFAAEPDASSAETRWRIAPAPSHDRKDDWGFPRFQASLTRNRHGATGDWVMEWNNDEQSFRAADRGPVVSIPADGPHRRQKVA